MAESLRDFRYQFPLSQMAESLRDFRYQFPLRPSHSGLAAEGSNPFSDRLLVANQFLISSVLRGFIMISLSCSGGAPGTLGDGRSLGDSVAFS